MPLYPAPTTASSGGTVPTFIAPTATFTIPQYTQALYNITIDAEGVIDGDGVLVEVD